MRRVVALSLYVALLVGAGGAVASCSALSSMWSDPVVVEPPPEGTPPAAEGKVWAQVGSVWVEVDESSVATDSKLVTLPGGVRFVLPASSEGQTTGGLVSKVLGGILATLTGNPMLAPVIAGAIKVGGDRLLARGKEQDPRVEAV